MKTPHNSPSKAPRLDIYGAFIRRINLSGAVLHQADFSEADASGALFCGADFKDARLKGTILRGADLTDAKNLTEQQLSQAIIDDQTRLPVYIDRSKLKIIPHF